MSEWQDRWKTHFDEQVKKFSAPEEQAGYESRALFDKRLELIAVLISSSCQNLSANPNSKRDCLDIGCNTGHLTKILWDSGFKVTGLDFSKQSLLLAKELLPQASFVYGDALALPFEVNQFDVVTSFGTLQILRDWRQALREMNRVLKPGGVAIVETNLRQPIWIALPRLLIWLVSRRISLKQARHALKITSGWGRPKNWNSSTNLECDYFDPTVIISEAKNQGWIDIQLVLIPDHRFWKPGYIFGLKLVKPNA